jgi:hypothetical protein
MWELVFCLAMCTDRHFGNMHFVHEIEHLRIELPGLFLGLILERSNASRWKVLSSALREGSAPESCTLIHMPIDSQRFGE